MAFAPRLWAALIVVVLVPSLIGYAQMVLPQPVTPTVLSGPDVGFRIEGQRAGTPMGKLVVRINGQWVEAELGSSGLTPLTAR